MTKGFVVIDDNYKFPKTVRDPNRARRMAASKGAKVIVLNGIERHRGRTPENVAKRVGVTPNFAKHHLDLWVKRGYVKRMGSGTASGGHKYSLTALGVQALG